MKRDIQRRGQHFLRGTALIGELVGHSTIGKHDLVLDIGAGSGAITAVLARRAARVIAYESDERMAQRLMQNMQRYQNVSIVRKDFLRVTLPDEPYKVFANIPFSLSSQIVRKLVFDERSPLAIYVIVQKQFAQKMIMGGVHFHGALGGSISPWWTARIRRSLRRTDFAPPPAVDTVLLELQPRAQALLSPTVMIPYGSFVYRCFAEPRFYRHVGGTKKPSELMPEEWVNLYNNTKPKR